MIKPIVIPAKPRVRVAFMAHDGGSCSTEYVFGAPRVLELADQFNRLSSHEQQFGSPSHDEVETGIALFVHFLAYCRAHGIEVSGDGTSIHYTREPHEDVIRTITYNGGFPVRSIDLECELKERAA